PPIAVTTAPKPLRWLWSNAKLPLSDGPPLPSVTVTPVTVTRTNGPAGTLIATAALPVGVNDSATAVAVVLISTLKLPLPGVDAPIEIPPGRLNVGRLVALPNDAATPWPVSSRTPLAPLTCTS